MVHLILETNLSLAQSSLFRLNLLGSEPQRFTCLHRSGSKIAIAHRCAGLSFCGGWSLNSGPYASEASSLMIVLSPPEQTQTTPSSVTERSPHLCYRVCRDTSPSLWRRVCFLCHLCKAGALSMWVSDTCPTPGCF